MRRLTAALAALLAVVLCACGGSGTFDGDEVLLRDVTRPTDSAVTFNYADGAHEPPTAYPGYISGTRDFFIKQLRTRAQSETESFIFSPASAALQLGALANAASGDTRQEILLALTGSLTLDELNVCSSYFKSRLEAVAGMTQQSKTKTKTETKETPTERLTLGGAVLADKSIDVKTSFLQAEKSFYGYDVFRCDGKSEDAAAKLSAYLAPFTPDSGIDLSQKGQLNTVSAVSVSDAWLEVSGESTQGTFNGSGGARQTEYFTSKVKLLHTDKADGVLKFTANTPLKLLLIAPKDGVSLDSYIGGFDSAELTALLGSMDITKQDTAALPCFSVKSGDQAEPLSGTLSKCGLYSLFGGQPTFAGLSYAPSVEMGEMYEIPAAFALDRSGVNAAAEAPVSEVAAADYTLDRPFLFMLLDNESNLPVLAGAYR